MLLAVIAVAMVGTVAAAAPAQASDWAQVINAGSGLCLQPYPLPFGSIYDNGAVIAQLPCDGSDAQYWMKDLLPDDDTGGFPPLNHNYNVINKETGMCLDVRDANTRDGATIQQWTCNNGGSEIWVLPGGFPPGSAPYWRNHRTGKCLDVPGGTFEPALIQQWRCTRNNNPAQAFTMP